MRTIDIWVDESGDFGKCDARSPYYITTFLLHDRANDITGVTDKLDKTLAPFGVTIVHAGPMIRREEEYEFIDIITRRRLFHRLFTFVRTAEITYHPFIVDKRHVTDDKALSDMMSKQIRAFLQSNLDFFLGYDRIVLHYDFGQAELTKILVSTFSDILNGVDVRKVLPADDRLFQATDLLCTLELLALKAESKVLSRSELTFFQSAGELRRTYLKPIYQKRI